MRALIAWFLALGLALAVPSAAQEEEDETPQAEEAAEEKSPWVRVYWDEKLRIQGVRKNFTTNVGGLIQNDTAFFGDHGDVGELSALQNGLAWRRVRLYAEGVFARFFEYKFMYDFAANNPPRLKDAFVSFKFPFAPIRVQGGRFRTRLSLEGGTSSINTTFLERGLVSAFVPSRNTGFLFLGDRQDLNRHLWWAVGLVQKETQFDIGSGEGFGVSGRFAYAWRDQESLDLAHVGVNFLTRPADDAIRFLERPESHIAPVFVDTGDMDAEDSRTLILEGAAVRGPFSLQTELATTAVRAEALGNPRFGAFYAFVSYFLTGESRRYDSRRASFGAVQPRRPFVDFKDDLGALELALRYSYLDLQDREVQGGILNDWSVAFNWYPNRHARVMTNLIRAKRTDVDPFWIFQIRFQWAY